MEQVLGKLMSIETKVYETKAQIIKNNSALEEIKNNNSTLEGIVF